MKPVIEVQGLSKSYRISHQTDSQAGYSTLKDDFAKFVKKPFGGSIEEERETFWALKDVTFEVNKGEIFGVIGKNGSGKSTLLKILSRIVDPTHGHIALRGRVASLLEVGTGFHPELTGRENVFFNGSMMGMSKKEIGSKFDEIVAFSEVEKFLDTPVKFYSSGMYVRLAFAVAAHLEPDILILDEVLSVGDAGFQQKSFKKILSTIEEGRTVIIVSHGIDNIKRICNRAMLLSNGHVKTIGATRQVIQEYEGTLPIINTAKISKLKGAKVLSAKVINKKGISSESPFVAEVKFQTDHPLPDCYINIHVESSGGQVILHSRTDFVGKNPSFKAGKHTATVEFERLGLNPGTYSLWFRVYAKDGKDIHMADSKRVMFEVSGKATDNMAILSLPSRWHWDSEV